MSSYSKWSRYYYPPNHPDIALIHKVEKPRKVTEFRPISMCNVIYRTIAKTIVNQLKTILHDVIDLSQSAFIPNRLITDNIIVGYECLHKIRYSKGKKKWQVALKLDISEAYYRVRWDFLKHIIIRNGDMLSKSQPLNLFLFFSVSLSKLEIFFAHIINK